MKNFTWCLVCRKPWRKFGYLSFTASFSSVLLGYPADWALHLLTTSATVFKIFLLGEAVSFWHAAYLPSLLPVSATVRVSEATWQTQLWRAEVSGVTTFQKTEISWAEIIAKVRLCV